MKNGTKGNLLLQKLPLLLSIAGFLLNLVAYYPGFMSPDSLDIYGQSIAHIYRDWHPPVMAWMWSELNHLHSGPQGMLVFQLVLLWGGFYSLATSYFSTRPGCIYLFGGLLIAPFIQNFAGYIIKDVQMALSWFLSFSIIARAEYKQRRMTWLEATTSFLFILYGSLVRINALPGALPLIYLWAGNCTGWLRHRAVIAGISLLSLMLILGVQFFLNASLKPEKQFPEYKLYLQDMTGVYVRTGKHYFPSFITGHPGFDSVYLRSNYTTATFDDLYWNAENKISFPALNDSLASVVRKAWIHCIIENPGVYLLNRWDGFLYFLRVKKRTWIVVIHAEVSPNKYGIHFDGNIVSRIFIRLIKIQSALPYMRPWFWLLVNIITLVMGFSLHSPAIKRLVLTLLLSSLLYLLLQFFIFQVDTDFRYFYWNCLSVFISIYFIVKEKKPSVQPGTNGT